MFKKKISSILITLVLVLSFNLIVAVPAWTDPDVTVTPATGGGAISADTTGGAWTQIGAITISEGASGDIAAGVFVLTIPNGFEFDTGSIPDVAITGTTPQLVANTPSAITATTISVTVTVASTTATDNSLIIGGVVPIRVRPKAGIPLASGNITVTAGTIAGVIGATNFGTLNEVAGAVATLTVEVQPSDALVDVAIAPPVQVKAVDAFGNTIIGENIEATLQAGTGVLSGTSPQSTNATGIATFNDLSIDTIGPGKVLRFTTAGKTVDSNPFTITSMAPVVANLDGDSVNVIVGSGTVLIDAGSDATVTDADSADFSGGYLTITQVTGTTNGTFSVDGTNVTSGGDATIAAGETIAVGGVAIGTIHAVNDGQGGNDLVMNFNTGATPARVGTLIRNLKYGTPSGSGSRNFNLTVNDGDYATSSISTFTMKAVLVVTTNSDAGDDTTIGANLAADTTDGSGLSIREAIAWAGAGDTVTFDGGMSGQTVTLSDQLAMEKDITLDGDLDDDGTPDITISGNNATRVIATVALTAAARLEGLTITNGAFVGGMFNSNSSPTIINCTFSGNSASNDGGGMFNFQSSPIINNCTFSGNTAGDYGGGIYNTQSSPTISNCTFSSNSAVNGSGIYNISSSPVITDCIFSDNSASSLGGGMFNEISSSPTITNCTFWGNSATIGGGICNINSSSPTITSCTFTSNSADTGGGMYNVNSSPTITNCILWDDTATSDPEISNTASSPTVNYCNVQGGFTGTGNIDADPLFVNAAGGDFHLQSQSGHWTSTVWVTDAQTSPCIDAGNPVSACGNEPSPNGGRINMGAYGNTVQASKSLPMTLTVTTNSDAGDDATTGASLSVDVTDGSGLSIREAIAWASAGDMVTFDGGMSGQTVTLSGTQLVLDKDIILDGDLDNDSTPDITISGNSTSRVFHGTGLTAAARLDGLTITDGNAAGSLGGGMYIDDCDATIINCTFSSNSANDGGGIYMDGACNPTITNCLFTGNTASSFGGAIFLLWGNPEITNCQFTSNFASSAGGAIIMFWGGSPVITNCLFAGNTSAGSGAIWIVQDAMPVITNSTFTGNSDTSSNHGDAIGQGLPGTLITINNCILWGDTGSGWEITANPVSVTYSNVQGGYTGTGNIDADPLFVNAAGGDYHLQATSPCIDTGSNAAVPGGVTVDFEGDTRIIDGNGNGSAIVDMGADETDYPVITSFTPTPASTGTSVTVTGIRFTGATAVKFGGTDAASFTVDSDNQITAVVGSGSTGKVTVITPGGTATSTGDFTFDNTPPIGPTSVQSTGHTIGTWSGDNTIDVTWTDATDAGSGLDGYSILWDTSATTIPDAVKDIEEGVQAATSAALADGNNHYFHIRSVDNTGNWQSTVHLGPFFINTTPIDTTPPTDPSNVQSTSHNAGRWSGDNTVDVTWTDATDAGSGLDGYSVLWDTSAATVPDAVKDIEEGVQATTSPVLFDGYSHYFHIRSVDNAGNWQSTVHLGPFFIDTTPPKPAEERTSPTRPAPARPAPVPATAGDSFVSDNVDRNGVFTKTVTAPSADGKVRVIIEKGVRGLSVEGKRLSWVTVRPAFYTPPPPAGAYVIGLCYRFQPSGATFNPPITLTYTYDESEIPAGIAEEDLVIALYDETNVQWVKLESTVDPVTNTITTRLSHFSVYAVLAHGIPPVQESAAPIQESTTPTRESTNWGLIGGISGACIVVVAVLLVVLVRRRSH